MSKIEVDAIDKQSGSTLTLGGSGTAVTLACGATQTGFGRTGTVNWQTSIKTTGFTAVSGEGYFCDTNTSGAFAVTLPASPSTGAIVAVSDYANTFDTANLTIGRNGSNIEGAASDFVINAEGVALTFVYADSTKGWIVVNSGNSSDGDATTFIQATGGTVSCSGDDRIHTFTGPGTFTVSAVGTCAANNLVSYAIVAGGGGGGGGYQGGGGGAGGFREVKSPSTPYTASPTCGYGTPANRVTVTAQGYPIVVGGGGPGGAAASPNPSGNRGTDGVNSSALGITSAGGGSGGAFTSGSSAPTEIGNPGGSGGGAGRYNGTRAGGTGNTPSVTPAQGTNGGGTTTPYSPPFNGGGGGGATSPGGPGQGSCFGVGGNGASTEITGSAVVRAGGGGSGGCGPASTGGPGGAGNGASSPGNQAAQNGTDNTGSGGGGGQIAGSIPTSAGGNGGSGVVIIRYKIK